MLILKPTTSPWRHVLAINFMTACLWFANPMPAQAFDYFQPLPAQPLVPTDNPQTAAKISLGKQLFYDKALSKDQTLSCNDCHALLTGGDNDQASAIGANGQATQRSVPGLWNIGMQTVLYWDGRAKTLEAQALDHLTDANVMGNIELASVSKRLTQSRVYRKAFYNAFKGKDSINEANISKALASFQRALLAPNSPFDRYLRGDKTAISKAALEGQTLFNETGCLACHFGTNFAGPAPGPAMGMGDGFYELFPNNLGTEYDASMHLLDDDGRALYSKDPQELHMWRVPPLRNIALSAPYFHNGSARTLNDAVRVMAKTQFLKSLTDDEIEKIVAFLNSLTGELPAVLRNSNEHDRKL